MRVIFARPPVFGDNYPIINHKDEFQWRNSPDYFLPMKMAQCCTMILNGKNEALWIDAPAEEMNEIDFSQLIINNPPDFIVVEFNKDLSQRYIEVINAFKECLPQIKIILCGKDLPKEIKTDYRIEDDDWHFKAYEIITTLIWPKDKPLPHINRMITRWWLYGYNHSWLKFIPAAFIQAQGRGVEDVLQEIEELIVMGFKEIVDISACFPTGEWLGAFCQEMIDRGYNKYIAFDCCMAFGFLKVKDFALMAQAGFRMIVWEHSNIKNQDLIMAKMIGMQSHLIVKFGYPGETDRDAMPRYKNAKWLLLNNWIFSVQAEGAIANPADYFLRLINGIERLKYHPKFIFNRIKTIKSFNDLKYYFRIGRKSFDRFGNFQVIGKASLDY